MPFKEGDDVFAALELERRYKDANTAAILKELAPKSVYMPQREPKDYWNKGGEKLVKRLQYLVDLTEDRLYIVYLVENTRGGKAIGTVKTPDEWVTQKLRRRKTTERTEIRLARLKTP